MSEAIISVLPAKGEKRLKAITELGRDEKNAATLAALAETEKGKCKTAAQKALALLDYKPATPLWEKLARGKHLGEAILMPSCSDCVSDAIAPVIFENLASLFALPSGTDLDEAQFDRLKYGVSVMLGKGSPAMGDVYRLAAENEDWMKRLRRKPSPSDGNPSFLMLNDLLRFWDAGLEELAKIFPAVLTASIVKSRDERLIVLAKELHARYGGTWLIPVFMSALLTETPESVFGAFSGFLRDESTATLLCNVLGMVIYSEQGKENRVTINWGNYIYGETDTRLSFGQSVTLNERWLWKLIEKPDELKPTVTLQTYNRGGVKYQDYDEMLLTLLPKKPVDGELKDALRKYFTERARLDDGETTLYTDALERFKKADE
jgi:hypothetical protein